MENFIIKLAGQYFEICPLCDYIREYCKDYIVGHAVVAKLQIVEWKHLVTVSGYPSRILSLSGRNLPERI